MDKELDLETLDKVVGGVSHEVAEDASLKDASLFRSQQIEKLKQEKEALKALSKDLDELSTEELDNVRAGMSRR